MDVFSEEYLDWIEEIIKEKEFITDKSFEENAIYIKDLYFRLHNFYKDNYIFNIDPSSNVFTFKYHDKCYIVGEVYDKDNNEFSYSVSLIHVMGSSNSYHDINDVRNGVIPFEQIELRNRMRVIKNSIRELNEMGVPLMKIYGETYSYIMKLIKRNEY